VLQDQAVAVVANESGSHTHTHTQLSAHTHHRISRTCTWRGTGGDCPEPSVRP